MEDIRTDETFVDENYALWHMCTRTAQVMLKARNRELDRYGITTRISGVLFTILRLEGKATPGSVSRETLLEPHTVSEQLTRMEKRGLIRKVRERDKNRVRVELTPEGHEIFRKSAERVSINDLMSTLSPAERKQLWVLLGKIRDRALLQLGMNAEVVYPTEGTMATDEAGTDSDDLRAGA